MAASGDEKAKILNKRRREESGSSGCLLVAVALVFILGAGAGAYYFFPKLPFNLRSMTDQITERVMTTVDSKNSREVTLFFADPQWTRLTVVKETMGFEPDKAKRIAKLVELLARGPSGQFGAVLPRATRVKQVFFAPNGVVVVDFEPGFEELKNVGAASEMLTVFALVHTIAENVEGVNAVRILVGGKEQETLAGQVSIIDPVAPRNDLLGNVK